MTHHRFFGTVAFTALAILGTSCSSSTPGDGGDSNAGQGGTTAAGGVAAGGTAAGGVGTGGQSGSPGAGGAGRGGAAGTNTGGSMVSSGGQTGAGGAAAGGVGAGGAAAGGAAAGGPGAGGAAAGGGQSGSAGAGGAGSGGAAGDNTGGSTVSFGGQPGAGGQSGAAGALCGDLTAEDPTTTSIAGTWDFTPSDGAKRTITVPGGGWPKQGITTSSGTYATQITIPDSGAAQSTLIEFGAVNFQSTLSVDGEEVATNTTSFTPSVFDVTKFVTPGQQHDISVLVKGSQALKSNGKFLVPVAADWSSNVPQGIFRSALVHVYPDVYISDAFVKTSVTDDTLTYEVSVANTGTTSQDVTLSGALSSWNCDTFAYPSIPDTTVTAAPGTTTKTTIGPIPWGLGTTSYWWPNVPYQPDYKARLHNLSLQVKSGDKVTQSKVVRFGFRQSERKRADAQHVYYYLNGIRVNYRGDNLQGANYDSIDDNGKTDAYDMLAGFLPPSDDNPGWPQAVRNYQKLNYNVVRIHQEPAAPYMLDVADELGLMIIGETAIRGSNNTQDFVAGHDNMVGHTEALVLRDRNHPSIIRWSQSNEAGSADTDSVEFETDLFNAITELDGTRPISTDPFGTGTNYGLPSPEFAVVGHYIGGLGVYTEDVNANNDNPYGQGEYLWPKDSSPQGLTWFGTSAMAMRRQDASDIRPYTLLSGWSSIVPGTKRTTMTIEQGGNPVFGEDNLPDPWSSPIIRRVQSGFSPVLVADKDYWEANKKSNSNGDWPATVPSLAKGASRATTLLIFNDTFSETSIDITWEVRADSATGTLGDTGTLTVDVPFGTMVTESINMTAPTSGTKCYLVLRAQKNGETLFEETDEAFNLN